MDSRSVSLATLRKTTIERLRLIYPEREAQALFRALATHFLPAWETLWLTSQGQAPVPPDLLPVWEAAVRRLLRYEPLAYITGEVSFGGVSLRVAPGVFIPRPETEAWASHLLNSFTHWKPHTILDIGTGSGALAIFFAKNMPNATIYAIDKSPVAIYFARENANRVGVKVRIERLSFGEAPLPADFPHTYDLIVSNPPYIPWSAYSETEPNVRLYEPPEALFCIDLSFYEAIAAFAKEHLSDSGIVAAELFPPDAEKVKALWEQQGLRVTLHQDLTGRFRWIEGSQKPAREK